MQFLPKDVTTLSTTPSAYKLFLDLKEDDDDQYVLYHLLLWDIAKFQELTTQTTLPQWHMMSHSG